MEQSLGFAHFLAQTDALGKGVLSVLLILSVASWYLILTKAIANVIAHRRAAKFLARFWESKSLKDARVALESRPADNAFAEFGGSRVEYRRRLRAAGLPRNSLR